jgi:GTP-binding protein
VFDWDPLVASVAELVDGSTTIDDSRRTNEQRRMKYHEMMDERARGRAEREAVREASVFNEDAV